MIELRCPDCRLVWNEDRSPTDSPTDLHEDAYVCPRCGHLADRISWVDPVLPTDVELGGEKELKEKARPALKDEPEEKR